MSSSNAMKRAACKRPQLRGKDLNLRPLGYETQLTLPALAFSIISSRMLTYFADVSRSFGPILGPCPSSSGPVCSRQRFREFLYRIKINKAHEIRHFQ